VDARRLMVLGAVTACALALSGPATGATGSFTSSDPGLDAIWGASVRTATDMIAPGPLQVDSAGRPCAIDLPFVLLDGTQRDRCPYVGDEAVIDRTLDASSPNWPVQRAMLEWFAAHQHADGSIPASPIYGGVLDLFDYNAYWLVTLHDYVLYSGDLELARLCWPNVVHLIDGFYAAHTLPNGLVLNDLGPSDYAYIRRRGDVVAYYNAQYAYALNDAVKLAKWLGRGADADVWAARERAVSASFSSAFWDSRTGAFSDTTADRATHPEDGNAFAVLSGLASPAQTGRSLDYVWSTMRHDYGNSIVDDESWDGPDWGYQSDLRVYPFITYFEVAARFEANDDARAFDLIRREWGYMLAHGPGTMWELIGPYGGLPTDRTPSFDAGWSSGAAPALTEYVLGVTPTSPGFRTFTVDPHPGDLQFAAGDVPTPHGVIHVSWEQTDDDLVLRVAAPPGTAWANQPRLRRNPTLG
jgi:hypothetical protein